MIFDFRSNIYETDKWTFESCWAVHTEAQIKYAKERLKDVEKYPFIVEVADVYGAERQYFSVEEEADEYIKNTTDEHKRKKILRDSSEFKKIIEEAEDSFGILTLYINENTSFRFKFYKTDKKDDIEAARRNLSAAIRSENKVFCWTGEYEEA